MGNVRGIVVEIGGNVGPLEKALQSVNSTIKTTQTSLRDVEKLLKLDPTNTELLRQKQDLLKDAIGATKDKLDALKEASENASKTAGNYDAWKAKYDPIKEEIDATQKKLKELKEQSDACDKQIAAGVKAEQKYNKLQADITKTETALDKLKAQSEEADKQLAEGKISQEKYDALKTKVTETEDKLKSLKEQSAETEKVMNEGKLAQEKYDGLQAEIKETESNLASLQEKAKAVTDEFGNPISPEEYNAIQREIIETEQALKDLETQAKTSTSALVNIEEAGKKMQDFGGKVTDVGKDLSTKVTAPILAIGAAAVKTTADFDSSMSQVKAVSGATGEEFDALRDKAREMGSKTKFSASEAADAMNYMAMSGWKTGDMLDGIGGIMDLAAASGEDLATTSDIVTDALTAFGMSASDSGHFADILAAASSNANTNVSMLGESFKYAAPVAGALGINAEDTSIALGLMANAGIKASQAGTALRTGLTNLAKPTKQMREYMEKYHIELKKNKDGSINLRDTMEDLRKKLGGLSESEQAAAAAAIFGKNSMAGWLSIVNASPQDFEKLTSAIDNCEGTAAEMAAIMQDNLNGQITILKSALEELAISIGDTLMPTIRAIVARIQEFVNWLNSLDEKTKTTVVKIGLLVAAIGPLLVVFGTIINKVGGALTGFSKLAGGIKKIGVAVKNGTGIFGKLGSAMGGVSGTVLAVVAVIGVLVAAFVNLWKNNEEFRTRMTKIWEHLKEVIAHFVERFQKDIAKLWEAMQPVLAKLKEGWDAFCNALAPVFTFAFSTISNTINLASRVIHRVIKAITQLFQGDFAGALSTLGDIFNQIWLFIVQTVKNAVADIIKIADTILSWFGTDWQTVWGTVSDFISGIWTEITSIFTGAWEAVKAVWEPVAEFFTSLWDKLHQDEKLGTILDVIAAPFKAAWAAIEAVWGTVSGFFTALWGTITGDTKLTEVLTAVTAPFTGAWEKIKEAWETVTAFFAGIWTAIHQNETLGTIVDVLSAPFRTAWTLISAVWVGTFFKDAK